MHQSESSMSKWKYSAGAVMPKSHATYGAAI